MSWSADTRLRAYRTHLAQATFPLQGVCDFRHKDGVKALGGRWSGTRWVANDLCVLSALCRSGTWFPDGYEDPVALADAADSIAADRAASKEATAARVAALEEANSAGAREEAAAAVRVRRIREMERDGLLLPSDETALVATRELGLSDVEVANSGLLPALGPRSGMSPVARVLRYVHCARASVRVAAENRAFCFDAEKMAPLYVACDARAVACIRRMLATTG